MYKPAQPTICLLHRRAVFLLALLFLSSLNSAFGQLMPWQAGLPRGWEDFKGTPGDTYAAYTHTETSYHAHFSSAGEITTTVSCSFDPQKSWKNTDKNLSPYILRHEQLHFCISELYARKIRKAFRDYAATHKRGPNTAAEIRAIFHQLLNASQQYNNLYDEETNHSIDTVKQKEWEARIESELKELEDFASK